MTTKPTLFIGLMTGTSVDGLDAALLESHQGKMRLLNLLQADLSIGLQLKLRQLCSTKHDSLELYGDCHRQLALESAAVVKQLLKQTNTQASDIRAIGSHGQTVRHRPDAKRPFTLQLGCHATLAHETGIDVIGDFRSADVAAGGQGAPLVPAFHQDVFASTTENRVILNLGGIANISYLPKHSETVLGFDTGPANALLDAWYQQHRPEGNFDRNGHWGAQGELQPKLLQALLQEPYFQQPYPKSTGKELFQLGWLQEQLPELIRPQDVQHTLHWLTAESVVMGVRQLPGNVDAVYVCGGGAHNGLLMQCLQQALQLPVNTTESLGLAPMAVESACFAWLAQQFCLRLPGNLPSVTGATQSKLLGAFYPA